MDKFCRNEEMDVNLNVMDDKFQCSSFGERKLMYNFLENDVTAQRFYGKGSAMKPTPATCGTPAENSGGEQAQLESRSTNSRASRRKRY